MLSGELFYPYAVLGFGFFIFLFVLAGTTRAILFQDIRLVLQPYKADNSVNMEFGGVLPKYIPN
jgi:hypothetical protein